MWKNSKYLETTVTSKSE